MRKKGSFLMFAVMADFHKTADKNPCKIGFILFVSLLFVYFSFSSYYKTKPRAK